MMNARAFLFTIGVVGCTGPTTRPVLLDRYEVGTTANQVITVECDGAQLPLVVTSGEARIDVFTPDGVISTDVGAGSNPWAAAAVDGSGARVVVTRQATGDVVLIDACRGVVLATATPTRVQWPEPVVIEPPLDVTGDGVPDRMAEQSTPTHPQAVVVSGNEVWVLFTNVLRYASPGQAMRQLPGVLWHARVEDGALQEATSMALPCINPADVVHDQQDIWVSCNGGFALTNEGVTTSAGRSSLVRVRGAVVDEIIGNADASFGALLLDDDRVVVADLLRGSVHQFDHAGTLLQQVQLQTGTATISAVTRIDDEVVAAGFAPADIIRDVFGTPTRMSLDTPSAPRGLVALAPREGGFWALLTLSSELIAVDVDEGARGAP
jgi:hypothetical protein